MVKVIKKEKYVDVLFKQDSILLDGGYHLALNKIAISYVN